MDLTQTYSIGIASKLSGLTPRQIRYLESKKLLVPQFIKVAGVRQRRYTQDVVDKLVKIARLRRAGFELGAAVAKVKKGDYDNENKEI